MSAGPVRIGPAGDDDDDPDIDMPVSPHPHRDVVKKSLSDLIAKGRPDKGSILLRVEGFTESEVKIRYKLDGMSTSYLQELTKRHTPKGETMPTLASVASAVCAQQAIEILIDGEVQYEPGTNTPAVLRSKFLRGDVYPTASDFVLDFIGDPEVITHYNTILTRAGFGDVQAEVDPTSRNL